MVRFQNERKGGDGNMGERIKFNETIQDLNLMKIPIMDRKYMSSNLRINPNRAKLDRIFVSPKWESKFPLSEATSCYKLTLDHVPIKVNLGIE